MFQGEMVPYQGGGRGVSELGEMVIVDAGRFGVMSDVSVPDDVVDLMSDIVKTGQILMRLASRLATYAQTPGTRELTRGCRDLATRLQEEFETRRGGGR